MTARPPALLPPKTYPVGNAHRSTGMTGWGHERRFCDVFGTSASPSRATVEQTLLDFLKGANSGLTRCSKRQFYSITSSARPSSESGKVRPSVLAVLRLMMNSTLVDCWTGKSVGFSPFNIRPV